MLTLTSSAAFGAGERLTQRCSAPPSNKAHMEVTGETRQAIAAVIARPDSNPTLYEQLWRPSAIEPFFANSWAIVLDYPGPLDPFEMAASIAANIDLARLGISPRRPERLEPSIHRQGIGSRGDGRARLAERRCRDVPLLLTDQPELQGPP